MITFRPRSIGKSMAANVAISDTDHYTRRIRLTHHYGYRRGEWANITGVVTLNPRGLGYRLCYSVVYPDGEKDFIAICDSCNYELEVKSKHDKPQTQTYWIDEVEK